MSSSFDVASFLTKIGVESSDKLTLVIREAHKHRIADDEITKAVECLLDGVERKPVGECLQKAACFGYPMLARLLLDKGLNINTRDRDKNTPLINACHTRHFEVARYLVERGAFIDARNKFKWSALKYSCLNNEKEFAKYLIEHGANTEIITEPGKFNIIEKLKAKNDSRYDDIITYLESVRASLADKKE